MALTVKKIHPEIIRYVAKIYLKPFETLQSVAFRLNASTDMISNIMFRGIAENILSDDIAESVFYKIVYHTYPGQLQRRDRWEKAFDLRSVVKEKERKAQNNTSS